jgi:hypothetical protein
MGDRRVKQSLGLLAFDPAGLVVPIAALVPGVCGQAGPGITWAGAERSATATRQPSFGE